MYVRLFFAVIAIFLVCAPVVRAKEYTAQIDSNYTIDANGLATVKQNISFTNTSDKSYITEYGFDLGSTRLKNVKAYLHNGTNIPIKSSLSANSTRILLTFPEAIVGKGKSLTFTIEYQNQDVAQKVGKVLEVHIPRIGKNLPLEKYAISLHVPREFGTPAIIKPDNHAFTEDQSYSHITVPDAASLTDGLTVIYGDHQAYDLKLLYHLENTNITPIETQIALPPDTAYQKLYYVSIDPKPQKIESDRDGNWIATYQLEAKQKQTIEAIAQAITYLKPTVDVPLPTNFEKNYITEKKYWEKNDNEIQNLAKQLKSPREIYTYLVNNFTYNYSRIEKPGSERLGASGALKDPENALCLEFTDAFVALSRAANVPARALFGYSYTENGQLRPVGLIKDTLHAWPDFYDAELKNWRAIDPTWGNTTGGVNYFDHLDYNHIVFTIHGSDSEKPFPAGFYRDAEYTAGDIEVKIAKNILTAMPQLSATVNPPSIIFPQIPQHLDLTFTNRSGQALYNVPVTIHNSDAPEIETTLKKVLPFSQAKLSVKYTPSWKTNTVSVSFYDQRIDTNIRPFNGTSGYLVFAVLLAGVTGITAIFSWRVLVSRRKR